MNTAGKIRQQRRLMNINQEELSKLIGVSLKTIQRWESGERSPRMEEIQKIAQVLNISVSELLSDTTEEKGVSSQAVQDTSSSGRDIELNDRAGRLVFKDGARVVDLPDTPDNKKLYWQIVERMLNAPAMA